MSFWTYLGGALVCVLGGAVIGFVAGRGKKPESSAEELQLLRDLRAKMEAAWNSHVQLDVERIKATTLELVFRPLGWSPGFPASWPEARSSQHSDPRWRQFCLIEINCIRHAAEPLGFCVERVADQPELLGSQRSFVELIKTNLEPAHTSQASEAAL